MNRKEFALLWLNKHLLEANKLSNDIYGMLLMLSTIDSFAQLWGNFPKNNNKQNFCDFVLGHTGKADSLKAVCPITLYYQYQNMLPPLRLNPGNLIPYDAPELKKISDGYLQLLPDKERTKAAKKHSYINLLYVLRSKLVHELNNPGTSIEFVDDKPIISCGNHYVGGKLKGDFWTLNFPKKYIYDLTWEVIKKYLDECEDLPDIPYNLAWD